MPGVIAYGGGGAGEEIRVALDHAPVLFVKTIVALFVIGVLLHMVGFLSFGKI
jgi:hypothetical protein